MGERRLLARLLVGMLGGTLMNKEMRLLLEGERTLF
jgi:hypothetical protein